MLEVCTGSKLKPEPGPYPRSSDPTRPDPSGTVKFRARTRPEITPQINLRERERERERGMNVARACEPASALLSLQAMRLSYFKNSDFAASLQINIMF